MPLMGKLFIILGVLLVIVGALLLFKIPIPFGKLPGDISYQGDHFQVYVPIVSCIVLSIVISLLYYLFSR